MMKFFNFCILLIFLTINADAQLDDITRTISGKTMATTDDILSGSSNPDWMKLIVPLNPGGYPGNWTDYEIKIFQVTNSIEEWTDEKMVYFYQSHGDPWNNGDSLYGDDDANVFFVDDMNAHTNEIRGILKWSIYTNITSGIDSGLSIGSQLVSESSVIDEVHHYASKEGCKVDWTTWQWYTNRHNLRASFIRYDSIGPQTNANNIGRWQPIDINWVNIRLE